jgi:hypothetical protein
MANEFPTNSRNDKARWGAGSDVTANTSTTALCFPSRETVKGGVLADLLNGLELTHWDCWRDHGSSRLAHHIHVLKADGWPIQKVEKSVSTRHGRVAQIGYYSMKPEDIAAAGERGQRFAAPLRGASL